MARGRVGAGVCLAAAAAAGLLFAFAQQRAAPRGIENILLVTLDTVRADRLGAYGYASASTPHFDALARRGILFTKAFTPAPLTLPSHVSLFSGLYPFRHGVLVNGTDSVPGRVLLLASELRSEGFATGAAVGSVVLRSETGIARGFDFFDESFAANAKPRPGQLAAAERRGEEVVESAGRWLDGLGKERFFLWVHLYDPHAPYDPPEPYGERFASDRYDGEIAYADACLGRLLDGLSRRGKLAKTLIVVAADHGESLGEHGEATHGVFLYDATLSVPLLIAPPGQSSGRRVSSPVSLVDVAPTIREVAGLPAAPSDGASLWPLLREERPERVVYSESDYPAVLLGWSPLRSVRSASEKYVEAPRHEHYDLAADPNETKNLFAWDSSRARTLAREMKRLRAAGAPSVGVTREPAGESDPEIARRLASLGSLTPRSPGTDLDRIDSTRTDPKDRIQYWDSIERGIAAQQAGRPEQAAAILENVIRKYPEEDPVLLRELALAFRRSRRVDRAIALYERVLQRFPPIAEDRFGLGVCWHLKGEEERALRAYEEAVRLDPQHEAAWVNLGQGHLARRRLDKAREAFLRVVRLDPKSVDGLSGLAAVAFAQRDVKTAAARLREALAVAPDHPATLASLARVELALGNREEARRLSQKLAVVRSNRAGGPKA